MIPNSWFYKLKYMSITRNQKSMQKLTKKKNQPNTKSSQSSLSPSSATPAPPQSHPHCRQRKSYHFTRDLTPPRPPTPDNNSASQFADPPRKSSKKRRSFKKSRSSNRASPRHLHVTSSVYADDCSCQAGLESVWTKPDSTPEEYPLDSCSSEDNDSIFPDLVSENENGEQPFEKMVSWSNSCHCRVESDILTSMSNNAKFEKLGGFDSISPFELPPIITRTGKSEKNEAAAAAAAAERIKTGERNSYIFSTSNCKEQRINTPVRKSSVNNSPGVKLRTNSPRLASKRFLQVHGRKSMSSGGGTRRSLSESFAVVKSSQDPHRDFKESMVEMIMENNMRTSKDLEDLLACYLSLNSDKYHDLIIKVFKQIWFEITDIRLK